MKKFANTLAVFIANLLRLQPTSWKSSATQADDMVSNRATFVGGTVNMEGKEKTIVSPGSPLAYLGDAMLNVIGMVVAIWLLTSIVSGFFAMLPYLIATAVVIWVISKFSPSAKGASVAS
jgi:hypothetical protein